MEPRLIGRGKQAMTFRRFPQTHGFNGAATYWSRKVDAATYSQAFTPSLQWSRDLLVAESYPPALKRLAIHRFNGAATYWSRKGGDDETPEDYTERLQWSRDLLVAESDGHKPLDGRSTRFNGAATYWSRKVQTHTPPSSHK